MGSKRLTSLCTVFSSQMSIRRVLSLVLRHSMLKSVQGKAITDYGQRYCSPIAACLPSNTSGFRAFSVFSCRTGSDTSDEAWLPRYFAIGREGAPIALQTVTFDLPQVGGVAQWMRELATKMQSQCCWDGFAEIIVKNGGNDKQVISRDEVEHWCDKNLESK